MRIKPTLFWIVTICLLALAAPAAAQTCPCAEPPPVIEQLVPEVIASFPHDSGSFTQGLLLHDGTFYESAGEYGNSDVRQVTIETGEVIRQVDLNEQIFAEGLTLVDDHLIQLSWRENIAIVWDLATFELLGRYLYETEGWGICYDGEQIYMSDGSSNLFVRDPQTFRLLAMLPVTQNGVPVRNLNELECVGDHVYANVWQANTIVRVQKTTGYVDAVIDASNLVNQEPSVLTELSPMATAMAQSATPQPGVMLTPSRAVLNGIAYNPDSDTYYLTGKLWSTVYEVRLVPAGS
ncbi:MAG: glutaminyl-peptide cyclotransferase [Anaerolineae bacterium]|nr:glutaminyl-peptide cyclotransferase [Anaerolineae bacterium]